MTLDADNIWPTIISVSIAPVLGLLAGLVASWLSHRNVLEQARVSAAAEARKDREEVTQSYLAIIATLRQEVDRLRERIDQNQVLIERLQAKITKLETEAESMRREYEALEDKYIMAIARQGHSGHGAVEYGAHTEDSDIVGQLEESTG